MLGNWDILEGTDTEPEFFVDGPSRCDIAEGAIGDCWLFAAAAALAMNKDLLYLVVPKNQRFQKDYNGTFHFRFWQFGELKDVVVDDFLPARKDNEGKPYLFALRSTVNNEFWPALLEKACAKLCGSYRAADTGFFSEAMEDLTGGVSEIYHAESKRQVHLYEVLLEAWDNTEEIAIGSYVSKESASLSLQYAGLRHVSYRFKLKPGLYFIIPNALKDYMEEEFLLRVFSDNKTTVEEYDQELESPTAEYFNEKFNEEEFNKEGLSVIVAAAFHMKASLIKNEDWKKLLDQTMYNGASGDKTNVIGERGYESLVNMLDRNRSGTIEVNEVKALCKRIVTLKRAFTSYATKDGFTSAEFLRKALNKAGYFLDNHTLCEFVRRNAAYGGLIYLDDFLICAFEVEEKFEKKLSQLTKLALPEEEIHADVSPKIL